MNAVVLSADSLSDR